MSDLKTGSEAWGVKQEEGMRELGWEKREADRNVLDICLPRGQGWSGTVFPSQDQGPGTCALHSPVIGQRLPWKKAKTLDEAVFMSQG